MPETRRAGFTIDDRGTQATLAWLDPRFDDEKTYGPSSWIGQLRGLRTGLLQTAQRLHLQNEAIKNSRVSKTAPVLPEVEVRRTLAKTQQKQVAETIAKIDAVELAVAAKRKSLKLRAPDDSSFARRQELRTLLRGMTDDDRRAALRDDEFRAAALEMPPVASGLSPATHIEHLRQEFARQFPTDTTDLADAEAALATLRENAAVVTRALSNEMAALGQQFPVPEPAKEPTPWA